MHKNFSKSLLIWLLVFMALIITQQKARAQHSEIGIKVVLSGALMFGPYYAYRFDEHNSIDVSVFAALEDQLVVPFALNAGYNAFFFHSKFRPQLGLQYSYLISPRRHKSATDPNGISILSLVPGGQYQWDNMNQNIQSRVWLAYFLDKPQKEKKLKIMPIGLDFSYGYKFH